MLPNFLVIGAPKSGSTSLWAYLRSHPDVFLPEKKELDFFNDPASRGDLSSYRARFANATEPFRGEASVSYSMHAYFPGTAARIFSALPEARIIYVVREPVARAVSHYVQGLAVGCTERPIDEEFRGFDALDHKYVCPSRYATQLRQYLEFFDRDRIHVTTQADLLERREETVAAILDFIGADPGQLSPDSTQVIHNSRERQVRANRLGERLHSPATVRAARRLPEPLLKPIRGVARRVLFRPVEREPRLDPTLAAELTAMLSEEMHDFAALTGVTVGVGDERLIAR